MRGLYVHIPFCNSICSYCDFFKRIPLNDKMIDDYLERLEIDLAQYTSYFSSVETIYIGGGTPSCLKVHQLERLFKILLIFTNIKEYTMEANPESLNIDKIKLLSKYHINRVSLGVQTFKEESLKYLNRKHTKEDVFNVINQLKENGINNLSIDMIFAIPNTSLFDIKNDLTSFYKLDIDHLSYYSLILEEKSVLNHLKAKTNDLEPEMYEFIMNDLEKHGYKQYEISSFSREKEAIHNKLYWQNQEYIGIGAGASGYLNGVRYQNEHLINKYMLNFINNKETINKDEKLKEELILGLRMLKGVNIKEINEKYNIDLLKKYPKLLFFQKKEMVKIDDYLSITRKGIMFQNDILLLFI